MLGENMKTEEMIRELKRLSEKHKGDRVDTGSTNWSILCRDVAYELEKLLDYKYMYESISK